MGTKINIARTTIEKSKRFQLSLKYAFFKAVILMIASIAKITVKVKFRISRVKAN